MPFDGADYNPWKGNLPKRPPSPGQELLEAAVMVGSCFPAILCLIDFLHHCLYGDLFPSPALLAATALSVVVFWGALAMRKRRIAGGAGLGG